MQAMAEDTTTDELFSVLSNSRRRAVIAMLDEHRDGVALRQLADKIGCHEVREDATEGERNNAQQAVYVSLYQSHLPVLEDHSVVDVSEPEFGQGGQVVSPGPEFDRALRTINAAEPGSAGSSIGDRLRDLL